MGPQLHQKKVLKKQQNMNSLVLGKQQISTCMLVLTRCAHRPTPIAKPKQSNTINLHEESYGEFPATTFSCITLAHLSKQKLSTVLRITRQSAPQPAPIAKPKQSCISNLPGNCRAKCPSNNSICNAHTSKYHQLTREC